LKKKTACAAAAHSPEKTTRAQHVAHTSMAMPPTDKMKKILN